MKVAGTSIYEGALAAGLVVAIALLVVLARARAFEVALPVALAVAVTVVVSDGESDLNRTVSWGVLTNPVPSTVTTVPPEAGPDRGERDTGCASGW
jgi:hypothetical protein